MKNSRSEIRSINGVRQYNKSEVPRLRWTPELHQHFVQAVECLGGKHRATPKRILQMMSVKGLKIFHIKSHLQMYRNMKVYDNNNDLSSANHLQEGRNAQVHDHKIISNVRSEQRPLIGTELRELKYDIRNVKHEPCFEGNKGLSQITSEEINCQFIQEQDEDTCFLSKGSNMEEDSSSGVIEFCDLSLSVSSSIPPTQMMQNMDQRVQPSQAVTDHDHHIVDSSLIQKYVNYNNLDHNQSLGTDCMINLDLTI
ncbi:Myb family transcription factor [Quillaja saponaria]|uniref:Myb family transcription factor n=1 Tax=Quillaja saponaria TaxID=32244 RepID=A0AAD7PM35_QUISA|nr:Myb family transcription factor [Quillaja saponaria]